LGNASNIADILLTVYRNVMHYDVSVFIEHILLPKQFRDPTESRPFVTRPPCLDHLASAQESIIRQVWSAYWHIDVHRIDFESLWSHEGLRIAVALCLCRCIVSSIYRSSNFISSGFRERTSREFVLRDTGDFPRHFWR